MNNQTIMEQARIELSAALGWPGGVSSPPMSWAELLRIVAQMRVALAKQEVKS